MAETGACTIRRNSSLPDSSTILLMLDFLSHSSRGNATTTAYTVVSRTVVMVHKCYRTSRNSLGNTSAPSLLESTEVA